MKVIVKQKLTLDATSTLTGELQASKLIVDEGAVFDGTSHMGKDGQPAGLQPQKNGKNIQNNKMNP